MSVIQSVAHQWNKAEFAGKLESYLATNREVMELFIGSTSCQSVCHLVAAMCTLPKKSNDGFFSIELCTLLDVLLECFLLLYVKELEQGALSQSEQLVLSLTVVIAKQIIHDSNYANVTEVEKSRVIINAMEKLNVERSRLRKQLANMG